MSKNEKSLNWSNRALKIGKCFTLEQLHPDTTVWLQRPETEVGLSRLFWRARFGGSTLCVVGTC